MHTLDDAGPSNMEESVKRVSPGCTWNLSLRKTDLDSFSLEKQS